MPGEHCDVGIVAGKPGCLHRRRVAPRRTCKAKCDAIEITEAIDADACCPSGATASTDSDCGDVCGDGVIAIAAGAGSCPKSCDDGQACTSDVLSDAGTCSARCSQTPIESPTDFDGCCPAGASANTDADCKPVCAKCNVGDGTCASATATTALTATTKATGLCLAAIPNTTSYDTPNAPTNQCLATDPVTLVIELAGASITLHHASVAAVYAGDPATCLTTGLIRGFVTKDDADVTPVPLLFGATLGSLLGSDNSVCGQPGDDDVSPDRVRGWYFYLNFFAGRVPYKD